MFELFKMLFIKAWELASIEINLDGVKFPLYAPYVFLLLSAIVSKIIFNGMHERSISPDSNKIVKR